MSSYTHSNVLYAESWYHSWEGQSKTWTHAFIASVITGAFRRMALNQPSQGRLHLKGWPGQIVLEECTPNGNYISGYFPPSVPDKILALKRH